MRNTQVATAPSWEVGHGVWAEIVHEVEDHEAGKAQQGLALAHGVKRRCDRGQPCGATQKSEHLHADASDLVDQEDGHAHAEDEQQVEEGRALGGQPVVWVRSATFLAAFVSVTALAPMTAARMVGVKMPMP